MDSFFAVSLTSFVSSPGWAGVVFPLTKGVPDCMHTRRTAHSDTFSQREKEGERIELCVRLRACRQVDLANKCIVDSNKVC